MESINLSALRQVHEALKQKGYSPISQIVGYILTGDPTYITNHAGARQIIVKIDRYELLKEMISKYFEKFDKARSKN